MWPKSFPWFEAGWKAARALLTQAPTETQHSDDLAVDAFAKAMKEKLAKARAKGRGGWEHCHPQLLSNMLHEHVGKGDPTDVANFCAFLWNLKQPITPTTEHNAETEKKSHWCGYENGEVFCSFCDAAVIHLNVAESERFLDLLDSPPKATDKLKQAMAKHTRRKA
jgi:hypothetical protein